MVCLVGKNTLLCLQRQSRPLYGAQRSLQSFTNLATASDARDGKVTGFDLENGGDSTHVTVTVQRSNRHYVVHLQLKQEGSDLKIISADGL